jgi:hypothetical protein|tara:strand:+ start:342 stop:806 length:465 start_codon:yes stop_codon:yes gene_type:complete
MNKKQIINLSIAVVVLIIAYVIFKTYVFRDLFFNRSGRKPDENGGDDENTPPPSNDFDYEPIEISPIGCGGSFNETIVIDYNNPEANMGGCGMEVLNFQYQLNTEFGQNLSTDGKYGANTRQAHQNVLDSMNGTWSGGYTVYVSDVDPDAVFYE